MLAQCPNCSAKLKIPDSGKTLKVRCPKCTTVFAVQTPAPGAAAAPAAPPVRAPQTAAPRPAPIAPPAAAPPVRAADGAGARHGFVDPNAGDTMVQPSPFAPGGALANEPFGELDNLGDDFSEDVPPTVASGPPPMDDPFLSDASSPAAAPPVVPKTNIVGPPPPVSIVGLSSLPSVGFGEGGPPADEFPFPTDAPLSQPSAPPPGPSIPDPGDSLFGADPMPGFGGISAPSSAESVRPRSKVTLPPVSEAPATPSLDGGDPFGMPDFGSPFGDDAPSTTSAQAPVAPASVDLPDLGGAPFEFDAPSFSPAPTVAGGPPVTQPPAEKPSTFQFPAPATQETRDVLPQAPVAPDVPLASPAQPTTGSLSAEQLFSIGFEPAGVQMPASGAMPAMPEFGEIQFSESPGGDMPALSSGAGSREFSDVFPAFSGNDDGLAEPARPASATVAEAAPTAPPGSMPFDMGPMDMGGAAAGGSPFDFSGLTDPGAAGGDAAQSAPAAPSKADERVAAANAFLEQLDAMGDVGDLTPGGPPLGAAPELAPFSPAGPPLPSARQTGQVPVSAEAFNAHARLDTAAADRIEQSLMRKPPAVTRPANAVMSVLFTGAVSLVLYTVLVVRYLGGIEHLGELDTSAFTLGFGKPAPSAMEDTPAGVPVAHVRGAQLYPLENGKRALVVAGEVALDDKARKRRWSIEAVVRNPEDSTARVWPSRKFPIGRPLNPELVARLNGPDDIDGALARAPSEKIAEGLYPKFTVVMFDYPADLSGHKIELRVLKGQDAIKPPAEIEEALNGDDAGPATQDDSDAGDGVEQAGTAAAQAGEKRTGTFVNLSGPPAKKKTGAGKKKKGDGL